MKRKNPSTTKVKSGGASRGDARPPRATKTKTTKTKTTKTRKKKSSTRKAAGPAATAPAKAPRRAAGRARGATGVPSIGPPNRPALPGRIYFATSPILFHALQETLGASNQSPLRFGLGKAFVVSRGHDKIGAVLGATGAPAAGLVLEEAIAAGAQEILVLGNAMALTAKVAIGDLIVPTEALSAEGTSGHYVARTARRAPNSAMKIALTRLLDSAQIPYTTGRIVTSDSLYHQTPARFQSYRRGRLLGLDMELAALLAISRFRDAKMAALLVASDSLAGDAWEHGADRPIFINSVVRAATAVAGWSD